MESRGEKGEEKLPKMCSFFAYGLRRHSADQLRSAMCIINGDYNRIEVREMGELKTAGYA